METEHRVDVYKFQTRGRERRGQSHWQAGICRRTRCYRTSWKDRLQNTACLTHRTAQPGTITEHRQTLMSIWLVALPPRTSKEYTPTPPPDTHTHHLRFDYNVTQVVPLAPFKRSRCRVATGRTR